jgi:DNA-binding transcriptional LysR family regulator
MNVTNVRYFIKVVELGSFIKAAEYCEVPRPTISRCVKSLEDSMGVRLLERTTRKLTLTEVGELFYLKARQIVEEIERVEKEIASEHKKLAGKITVFAPVILTEISSRQITAFSEQYPELVLEVKSVARGQQVGLNRHFDLLMHLGEPEDSSFIATPLAELAFDYYVSPGYLEKFGAIESPQDLAHHRCIFNPLKDNDVAIWQLGDQQVKPNVVAMVDSPYLALSFAREGMGVCRLPKFSVAESVREGKLQPLFDGHYAFRKTMYGLYPSKRFVPVKIKLLIEYIKENLQTVIAGFEENRSGMVD